MSLITRTFTFTDGTTAYGSQVDSEIANIVNTLNNLDAATKTWDQISITNATAVPLTVDNSSGTQHLFDCKISGVVKFYISSDGFPVINSLDGTKSYKLYIDNSGVLNTLELT